MMSSSSQLAKAQAGLYAGIALAILLLVLTCLFVVLRQRSQRLSAAASEQKQRSSHPNISLDSGLASGPPPGSSSALNGDAHHKFHLPLLYSRFAKTPSTPTALSPSGDSSNAANSPRTASSTVRHHPHHLQDINKIKIYIGIPFCRQMPT